MLNPGSASTLPESKKVLLPQGTFRQRVGYSWLRVALARTLTDDICLEGSSEGLPTRSVRADTCIDFTISSPPFSGFSIYSDALEGWGNAATDDESRNGAAGTRDTGKTRCSRCNAPMHPHRARRCQSTCSSSASDPRSEEEKAQRMPGTHTAEDVPRELWQRYARGVSSQAWFWLLARTWNASSESARRPVCLRRFQRMNAPLRVPSPCHCTWWRAPTHQGEAMDMQHSRPGSHSCCTSVSNW